MTQDASIVTRDIHHSLQYLKSTTHLMGGGFQVLYIRKVQVLHTEASGITYGKYGYYIQKVPTLHTEGRGITYRIFAYYIWKVRVLHTGCTGITFGIIGW